eukprot:Opistho-2@7175
MASGANYDGNTPDSEKVSFVESAPNIPRGASYGVLPPVTPGMETIDPTFLATAISTPRLLLIGSRVKTPGVLVNACREDVVPVLFQYEGTTSTDLIKLVLDKLEGRKCTSIGLVAHSDPGIIYICGASGEKPTSLTSLKDVRQLWLDVCGTLDPGGDMRVDLLASNVAASADGLQLLRSLETLTRTHFTASQDIAGGAIEAPASARRYNDVQNGGDATPGVVGIGELYFRPQKLKGWSLQPTGQLMDQFEKIRVVGKGAYGAAVLYRKRDDDSLVILKEINMHDLNASERQMALNEVDVLSILDHPNIISYYDSFEEDGTLMIEMEYADGGTLAQYLANQQSEIPERDIITMFRQMVDGVAYIHANNIMHRDLKTANIFLTSEGIVKLGDFGIAKVMSTSRNSNTVLGTPYYISPELCEGRSYNQKSDIWALGCILYEMACLQRTFEGTNLPALVNKIIKGTFAPVKDSYSEEFRQLVNELLQRDPEVRPSADEILTRPVVQRLSSRSIGGLRSASATSGGDGEVAKASTQADLWTWGSGKLRPLQISFPPRIRIRSVAIGGRHCLAATVDGQVFSWGDGSSGQLGHGNTESYSMPLLIEALVGKSIASVSCGDDFSAFNSENGLLMTCGSGARGALGHGDYNDHLKPRLVESLLVKEIASVSCGAAHMCALTGDAVMYGWGLGQHGRLGLGSEESYPSPQQIPMPMGYTPKTVICGVDGTMVITDMGRLLACGNNEDNKLALNSRFGFLMQRKHVLNRAVIAAKSLAPVKILNKHRVTAVALGQSHSAVLCDSGCCYMFGCNREGQLGDGTTKARDVPIVVKALYEKKLKAVACGSMFTIGVTYTNEVYSWGRGDDGRLCTGKVTDHYLPVQITLPTESALGVNALACANAGGIMVLEIEAPEVTPRNPRKERSGSAPASGRRASRARSAGNRSGDEDGAVSAHSSGYVRRGSSGSSASIGDIGPDDANVPDWLKSEMENAEDAPPLDPLLAQSVSHVALSASAPGAQMRSSSQGLVASRSASQSSVARSRSQSHVHDYDSRDARDQHDARVEYRGSGAPGDYGASGDSDGSNMDSGAESDQIAAEMAAMMENDLDFEIAKELANLGGSAGRESMGDGSGSSGTSSSSVLSSSARARQQMMQIQAQMAPKVPSSSELLPEADGEAHLTAAEERLGSLNASTSTRSSNPSSGGMAGSTPGPADAQFAALYASATASSNAMNKSATSAGIAAAKAGGGSFANLANSGNTGKHSSSMTDTHNGDGATSGAENVDGRVRSGKGQRKDKERDKRKSDGQTPKKQRKNAKEKEEAREMRRSARRDERNKIVEAQQKQEEAQTKMKVEIDEFRRRYEQQEQELREYKLRSMELQQRLESEMREAERGAKPPPILPPVVTADQRTRLIHNAIGSGGALAPTPAPPTHLAPVPIQSPSVAAASRGLPGSPSMHDEVARVTEARLKNEISDLKLALARQTEAFTENNDMVRALQEQLRALRDKQEQQETKMRSSVCTLM